MPLPMRIGSHLLKNRLIVAPMAGVTDRPFRQLCKRLGAGMAVSEMVTSNSLLYGSAKTARRANHEGEVDPISVQIAGADPAMMAEAARHNVDRGAQIIDINMGCPAKKVCNVMAGSALLQDEPLVARILDAVVRAVPEVPVTLKIRTGWDRAHRNALAVLKIAENAGIQALAMHGRTRACGYSGSAEYDTIRAVKACARIPVIANGDITTPEKAQYVLDYSGADAVMIGRAAQGRPWIFREIQHYLDTGTHLPQPEVAEIHSVLLEHIHDLYGFYGEVTGVRVARKHISWYTKGLVGSSAFRHTMNRLDAVALQSIAAMDALAMFGEDAHMAVPLILKHLASSQWQLRVTACDTSRPSSLARRQTNGRKPTPCTRPAICTRSRVRSAAGVMPSAPRQGPRSHRCRGESDREPAALPRAAVQLDLPSPALDQAGDDRQPQARAHLTGGASGLGAVEPLEDALPVRRRDADPRILDHDLHAGLSVLARTLPGARGDGARGGHHGCRGGAAHRPAHAGDDGRRLLPTGLWGRLPPPRLFLLRHRWL